MKKSQPDFSILFYGSHLPCWSYALHSLSILDVNQAAIDFYGYSKKEFLQLTLKDLCSKEDILKLEADHADLEKSTDRVYSSIFTQQKKNGKRIRMKVDGHKVDYHGITSLLVVCQPLTDEKEQIQILIESEEALRESEEKFRTIFEIASLGIAQVDPSNGQIILVNAFYESITGYTIEELLKMTFVELTHPDDREKDWEVFSKAMRGEVEYRNVKRYLKKDGSIVWVRLHLAFIRDRKGNPTRTVAICEDITAQKEEEQHMKLLKSVITNTNDAILITEAEPFDEPGPRIIYVNEAFTKITGYSAEEVIGKTPRILQGPNSDKAELARLSRALRNWETCEITTINYKKNGEEFWINFSVSPVANENGWYTHWIAIERDVTEQKQKEIEKELLGKISLNFSIENDLPASAYQVCRTICEFGKFDFAELWLPNLENSQIQLLANEPTTPNAEIFYKWSKDVTSFGLAEGLPGMVWLKKTSILWNDIRKKDDFIRKMAAEKAGIQTALGIPLLFNEEVVGVLLIGSQRELKYLKKYVNVFEQLEQFIGSEISRKKLENDLNHLYQTIPDIMCLVDFKGRFLKMNKAGIKLLGFSEEELLFHPFDEFIHPDDKNISENELNRLIRGETTYKFENRYITKGGDVIWLTWTCNSVLEEGLIYATAKDITEKKLSDEKIILANERFEMVTKATNDAIWDWDVANKNFYRSHGINKFFGVDAVKLMKDEHFWKDKFHPSDLPKIQESVERSIADPLCDRWEMEYRVFNEKDETVYVMDRGLIVRDKKGKAVRMVGAMTDITERKNFEQKLLELNNSLKKHAHELELTNEQLEQFAFIASHDLQEPLRMISSFLDQLKRRYGDALDKKGHQYIHFATDGANRMKQIILDLLEYSRAGKLSESMEEVDMNELLEDYLVLRRKLISEKSVKIKSQQLPKLTTFKVPLTQTMHSLIDNAIKYSNDGQPVHIELFAEESDDFWRISVKDNGIGIDPKFFEKIFTIFQRLHNREQYEGTGIGLSIAKKNVESCGGKIWLESILGMGSTFHFTIPKIAITKRSNDQP